MAYKGYGVIKVNLVKRVTWVKLVLKVKTEKRGIQGLQLLASRGSLENQVVLGKRVNQGFLGYLDFLE